MAPSSSAAVAPPRRVTAGAQAWKGTMAPMPASASASSVTAPRSKGMPNSRAPSRATWPCATSRASSGSASVRSTRVPSQRRDGNEAERTRTTNATNAIAEAPSAIVTCSATLRWAAPAADQTRPLAAAAATHRATAERASDWLTTKNVVAEARTPPHPTIDAALGLPGRADAAAAKRTTAASGSSGAESPSTPTKYSTSPNMRARSMCCSPQPPSSRDSRLAKEASGTHAMAAANAAMAAPICATRRSCSRVFASSAKSVASKGARAAKLRIERRWEGRRSATSATTWVAS